MTVSLPSCVDTRLGPFPGYHSTIDASGMSGAFWCAARSAGRESGLTTSLYLFRLLLLHSSQPCSPALRLLLLRVPSLRTILLAALAAVMHARVAAACHGVAALISAAFSISVLSTAASVVAALASVLSATVFASARVAPAVSPPRSPCQRMPSPHHMRSHSPLCACHRHPLHRTRCRHA